MVGVPEKGHSQTVYIPKQRRVDKSFKGCRVPCRFSFSLSFQGLANIPRECYYLTTKVGRYLPEPTEMFDFRAERVIRSVDESLERLGLTYIDVIQVVISRIMDHGAQLLSIWDT